MSVIVGREDLEILIKVLKKTNDINMKAIILQSYMAEYGPIPDEYGERVREALTVKGVTE